MLRLSTRPRVYARSFATPLSLALVALAGCEPRVALGGRCTSQPECERTPRSVILDGVEYGVCPPTVGAPISC